MELGHESRICAKLPIRIFKIETAFESLLPRNNLHTSWSDATQWRNSKQPAPVVKKIRKFSLTRTQIRMAQDAMASRDTSISELCKELGVTPVTLYQYIDPNGDLCTYRKRVLITNGLINCPGCPLSVIIEDLRRGPVRSPKVSQFIRQLISAHSEGPCTLRYQTPLSLSQTLPRVSG